MTSLYAICSPILAREVSEADLFFARSAQQNSKGYPWEANFDVCWNAFPLQLVAPSAIVDLTPWHETDTFQERQDHRQKEQEADNGNSSVGLHRPEVLSPSPQQVTWKYFQKQHLKGRVTGGWSELSTFATPRPTSAVKGFMNRSCHSVSDHCLQDGLRRSTAGLLQATIFGCIKRPARCRAAGPSGGGALPPETVLRPILAPERLLP